MLLFAMKFKLFVLIVLKICVAKTHRLFFALTLHNTQYYKSHCKTSYTSNIISNFFLVLLLFSLNGYTEISYAAKQTVKHSANRQCNAQAIKQQQQNAPNKLLPELAEQNLSKNSISNDSANKLASNNSDSNQQASKPNSVKQYSYKIINKIPHDKTAFTQGLVFYKNNLYESTGLLGSSSVRKLDSKTGKTKQQNKLDKVFFGEGISINNNRLVQISWKSERIFIYDTKQLTHINHFKFKGEGWGITSVNNQLLISDGSSTLKWLNYKNGKQVDARLPDIAVSENGVAIRGLNELEYANGFIYANVWPSDCIAQIDPLTGNINAWINLVGLYPENSRPNWTAILNGIAHEKDKDNFFVTGKYWPYIYEIEIFVPKKVVEEVVKKMEVAKIR